MQILDYMKFNLIRNLSYVFFSLCPQSNLLYLHLPISFFSNFLRSFLSHFFKFPWISIQQNLLNLLNLSIKNKSIFVCMTSMMRSSYSDALRFHRRRLFSFLIAKNQLSILFRIN